MTRLSWNCRGLAHGPTIRALRVLVHKEDLVLIFVVETKISGKASTARGLSSFVDSQGAVDLGFSRNLFT